MHADTHLLSQQEAQQDSRPKKMLMQQSESLHKKGHTRARVGVARTGAVVEVILVPAQHCRCEGSHIRRPCNRLLRISLTSSTTRLERGMQHTESSYMKRTERLPDAHAHQQGFTPSASPAAQRLGVSTAQMHLPRQDIPWDTAKQNTKNDPEPSISQHSRTA